MACSEKESATVLHLKEKLTHLNEELSTRGQSLANLTAERDKLLLSIPREGDSNQSDKTLSHYHHILALVKEIHLLELKVKDKQKEYETKNLLSEATRLGQEVLIDSLCEDECVLKKWSKELREISNRAGGCKEMADSYSVSNITYHGMVDQLFLIEELGFTVLCQGVHVRVRIKSETQCSNIHLPLLPTSAKIGVSSDTFVPKLIERVPAAVANRGHISEILSVVSQYIQEDMAPYALIIPMKKKGGKSKAKLKEKMSTVTAPVID